MTGNTAVYLHAGAHRTGTSSFQNMLSQNRDLLQDAGYRLAYPGRDGIEGGKLKLKLPNPRHAAGSNSEKFVQGATRQLARQSRGAVAGLILSEENIPGRMFHFYYGQFFPAAETRMKVLKQALPGPLRHLVYVVRPYGALFTSGFRKRAEDNSVDDFANLRTNMMAIDTGWVELIAAFQAHLQPEKITVIDYAARGQSTALLETLLGQDMPDLQEPEQRINTSATDRALDVLQDIYRKGETLERGAWQDIIERHADDNDPRRFATFTAAQDTTLKARYEVDLNRIAALADVTLIR